MRTRPPTHSRLLTKDSEQAQAQTSRSSNDNTPRPTAVISTKVQKEDINGGSRRRVAAREVLSGTKKKKRIRHVLFFELKSNNETSRESRNLSPLSLERPSFRMSPTTTQERPTATATRSRLLTTRGPGRPQPLTHLRCGRKQTENEPRRRQRDSQA